MKGSGTADLNSAQEELLALLLEEQGVAATPAPRITPRAAGDDAPLSFAQRRLWFLEQWHPDSALYNVFDAWKLHGALDVAALQRALSEVMRRHETLRSTFENVDGEPRQVIHPPREITLPVIDLSHAPENTRAAEIERRAAQEASRPFDLARGPLLRATLLRAGAQEHVLLLNVHHIVFDLWSRDILKREMAALYDAYRRGVAAPLADPPIQYADFACWQRRRLQEGVRERQLAYWKNKLRGELSMLELPADHPRPAMQTFRGGVYTRRLPAALGKALAALSQRHGATLFMTVLAAFKVLLHRYTSQDDIIVGSPISNRLSLEVEGLIGFFLNTLVLRTDLSGDPSFSEALQRVRETALEAYDHQELPFEELVEAMQPGRNLGHTPLFQVAFVLQSNTRQTVQFPGLTLTPLNVNNQTAKFDLTLFVAEEAGSELTVTFEYNTDLFETATIARLCDHFSVLLDDLSAHPGKRLSELALLTEEERQALLHDGNATATPYPRDATLAQLFEQQAAATPDHVALVHEHAQLTYAELNQRANALAHHLQAHGAGPEVRIGLCLERSLDLLVGLVAILKAGAAYVPLDPAYPAERQRFILQDAGITLLLTQAHLRARLPDSVVPTLCLDSDWPSLQQHYPDHNPVSQASADSLAYILYTSGSTGQPKGVLVPQRGVVRLVKNTDYVHICPTDVFLQAAPLTFDASTFEIWGALLNGARLVLLPDQTPSLELLGETLRRHQVSILWLTAGLFHLMVDERLDALKPVRQLLAGGDVLSVPHAQKVLQHLPDCQLINGYGPTENTTFTCCYRIPRDQPLTGGVPIGRPIANTHVYLLDRCLHPVPLGVPGELYIGGDGLARGYLNQPDLTAEKFIPHPYAPGQRLYKTGDLARYRPDGVIEFLGRRDRQVKIRGFRIELGEIEAVLAQHPAVRESVVVARHEPSGDKHLAAYVVPRAGAACDTEALRAYLQSKLPAYMLPQYLLPLAALPLTPNGKVDKHALPGSEETGQRSTYMAARDDLELQLTRIWEKVLGVRNIGVRDDFFERGGHSLLAVRLVAHIKKTFGKNLPVADLFKAPTVEQLAMLLRQEGCAPAWSPLVAIQPAGAQPIFFGITGAGGNLFGMRQLARHLGADQPFYGLQPPGLDGKQTPLTRVEDMAENYLKAIRSLQPEGPYYLGGACFGAWIAFELARKLHAQGQQVALLALIDSPSPCVQGNSAPAPHSSKLREHWDNLNLLDGKGKALYLAEKVGKKLRLSSKRGIYKLFRALGLTIPEAVRTQYVFDADVRAQKVYRTGPYPGRITLFWASQSITRRRHARYQREWERLAARGVESYSLDCDHITIFREPQVRTLAKHLSDCISTARAQAEKEAKETAAVHDDDFSPPISLAG
ncbi:MAG: amino acid adenylation domain-containing protein [Pseudomonadota bacterium]